MTNEAFEKTIYDLKNTIAQTLMTPTNKAGWPFIIGFAIVSVLLAMVSSVLGAIGLVLTLWCVYFFRDPVRMVPVGDGWVVSPADGRVTDIAESVPLPKELRADPMDAQDDDGDFTRISIFLSVFDVHVNRIPAAGTIKKIVYRPGLFLNAGSERASIENERCAALLDLKDGRELGFVQIAGLIARRILCDAKEGDVVNAGDRYGLIRFGSRMDIYLPKGVVPQVAVGQRMIGGETVLADLNGPAVARDVRAV
mgnify:CR=1 FL=1